MTSTTELATFAGGCFWCIQSAFSQIQGVIDATPGYAGGHTPAPDYKAVCDGDTGHAEVVRITFDNSQISYRELLEILFALHDPTQLNRQGNDVGTQYRSEIFYHSEQQKQQAEAIIAEIEQQQIWPDPVVTKVTEINNYTQAEDYHKNYFENNPQNQYCNMVVAPKLAKFKKTFAERLK